MTVMVVKGHPKSTATWKTLTAHSPAWNERWGAWKEALRRGETRKLPDMYNVQSINREIVALPDSSVRFMILYKLQGKEGQRNYLLIRNTKL